MTDTTRQEQGTTEMQPISLLCGKLIEVIFDESLEGLNDEDRSALANSVTAKHKAIMDRAREQPLDRLDAITNLMIKLTDAVEEEPGLEEDDRDKVTRTLMTVTQGIIEGREIVVELYDIVEDVQEALGRLRRFWNWIGGVVRRLRGRS